MTRRRRSPGVPRRRRSVVSIRVSWGVGTVRERRDDDVIATTRIWRRSRLPHIPWFVGAAGADVPSAAMSGRADLPAREAIAGARAELHAHGMRWTPQRRLLVEILLATRGHVTGTELVERCRRLDPETTPSTVYRTLDALEEIGLVRHSHGADGREEYHVLPTAEHGHLRCERCGATWEIEAKEASQLMRTLAESRGFALNLSHLTIVGRCAGCGDDAPATVGEPTPRSEGSPAHG